MPEFTITFTDEEVAMIEGYLGYAASTEPSLPVGEPVEPKSLQDFVDAAIAIQMLSVRAWASRQATSA